LFSLKKKTLEIDTTFQLGNKSKALIES